MKSKNLLYSIIIIFLLAIIFSQIYIIFFAKTLPYKTSDKYINKIEVKNSQLRNLALSQASACKSGDRECLVNQIYKYVVNNYHYYSDPRVSEYIQPVNETIKNKGGDCEDLTILLNSLLENAGIKTYFVLTPSHSFTLACDINSTKLYKYILEDLKRTETTVRNEQVSIKQNYYYYLGGEGEKLDYAINFTFNVQSSEPVEIHIVPSKEEYKKAINNEEFMQYTSYYAPLTTKYQKSIKIDKNIGILIYNENENNADVELSLKKEIDYYVLDPDNISITTYKIDDSECIVLESTAGEYGYPGISLENEHNKTAIDPITRKEYLLT